MVPFHSLVSRRVEGPPWIASHCRAGGVLFLDEIGELGSDEQAMLLRALEEKTFLPLGSGNSVRNHPESRSPWTGFLTQTLEGSGS
jgi:hypothetical protein